MAKKISLITGGAGFIGSHLAESLVSSRAEVRVLDNLSTGSRANLKSLQSKISFSKGDIRDAAKVRQAMRGVDTVYHLAAISSVLLSVERPAETWEVNLQGLWNMLEAARLAGVRRLVFASSASVYGACEKVPFREDWPPEGTSPYAQSKLLGEQMCALYSKLYGLETASLRFFSVYGPRQNPKSLYSAVIPTFATLSKAGKTPTVYGDGSQTRDFIYVGDIVRAIRLASRRKTAIGQAINVGTGKQTSVIALLKAVQSALGVYIEPAFAPLKAGDDPRTCADTRRAKKLLGFTAKTPFKSGLTKTVRWFAEHGS